MTKKVTKSGPGPPPLRQVPRGRQELGQWLIHRYETCSNDNKRF